ncbi:MAG: D-amino acid dehydrogenase [Neomegalonema sp.]|nr:D-amino acid dehydrogenase [Neomegalonema sp.]
MTKSHPKKIAVIGAGITGVTTAWALMQRGAQVTVIERHRYAAMETSFANGGQLSASNAETWNQWSTVLKGLKWLMKSDAPFLMNLSPSWRKYSWIAEFLSEIPHYKENTVETVRLAIKARAALLGMAREAGVDFNLEKRGILHIYRTKYDYDHAAEMTRLYATAGLDRRAVTSEEMKAIEPALTGDFHGGFYTESDMTGDIHRFSRGLSAAAEASGIEFRYDTEITQASSRDGGVMLTYGTGETTRFDAIVVCAGVGSRDLAAQLGDRLPIYPVKGYSITVSLDDEQSQDAAPWVSLLDDEAKIVSARLGKDRFRVAGTAEINGYNLDIRADRVQPLINWTRRLFPGMATDKVRPWAGLRPMMPSMMPRVGAGRAPGVFYNTGHGHLGWTLSGATAEMIAEQIAGPRSGEVVPLKMAAE